MVLPQEVLGNVKVSGAGSGISFPDGTWMGSAATGMITGVMAGTGLTGGGTSGSVTLGVANSGITNAMLAANSVTNADIADGSLSPSKTTGTAATLGANAFHREPEHHR